MVGRRYSDSSNGGSSYSATRFLHGLLWFVTGFSLSWALMYIKSPGVSKFVVQGDLGKGQFQVQHDASQVGMTRVFLYEAETPQGKNSQYLQKNFTQQQQGKQQLFLNEDNNLEFRSVNNNKQSPQQQILPYNQQQDKQQQQQQIQSDKEITRFHSPTEKELEVLLELDSDLKAGLSDIGVEIVDDEMLQDQKRDILNAYPRWTTAWDVMDRAKCFLFIGVLTSPQKFQQREALREAWVLDANKMPEVVVRFVMLETEFTIQMEQEVKDNGDFLFVKQHRRQHRFDLHRVYQLFEHVAEHYQASFVLKTDDGAYVNVPILVNYLQKQCENEDCLHERLYIGYEQNDSPVMRDISQSQFPQWINQKYYEVIKSDVYIPYMMGGGYILSGDLVETLVSIHRNIGLFWSPIEDATVGMWLAGLNIRRVTDQHSFLTQEFDCCFYEFPDMPWHPWIGYNRLVVDVCKTDTPRLILHSISNSTFMKTLGWRVKRCDFSTLNKPDTTV